MIHVIARGNGYCAVVSAADGETAAEMIVQMFARAGRTLVGLEVMTFDPACVGGVLILPEEIVKKVVEGSDG